MLLRFVHALTCALLLRPLGRPSGTSLISPSYPALKRGAKLARPSGADSRALRVQAKS
jgi:hypothetical protein